VTASSIIRSGVNLLVAKALANWLEKDMKSVPFWFKVVAVEMFDLPDERSKGMVMALKPRYARNAFVFVKLEKNCLILAEDWVRVLK